MLDRPHEFQVVHDCRVMDSNPIPLLEVFVATTFVDDEVDYEFVERIVSSYTLG